MVTAQCVQGQLSLVICLYVENGEHDGS